MRTFFWVFLLFAFLLALGQKPVALFENYSTEDGLPSNYVYSLYRDHLGFLWIGTQKGLVRYDGYTFKKIENAKDTLQLTKKSITAICGDSKNNIWFLSDGILCEYNTKFEHLTVYPPQKTNGFSANYSRIFIDSKDTIWVGNGEGLGIFIPDSGKAKRFTHHPSDAHSIPKNGIMSICEDEEGTIWFANWAEGIYKYNKRTKNFTHFPLPLSAETQKPFKSIWNIKSDGNGKIYFTLFADDKIGYFDTKKSSYTILYHANIPRCLSIQPDSKGNIWVTSTKEGLFCYNPYYKTLFKYTHDEADKSSIPENRCKEIILDKDNNLWFTSLNTGFSKLDLRFTNSRYYDISSKIGTPLRVNRMLLDKNQNIWIASTEGLFVFNYAKNTVKKIRLPTPEPSVDYITEGTEQTLWIQCSGKVYSIDKNTGNFKTLMPNTLPYYISGVYHDSKKNLWVLANKKLLCYPKGNLNEKPRIIKQTHYDYEFAYNLYKEQNGYLYVVMEYELFKIRLDNYSDTATFPIWNTTKQPAQIVQLYFEQGKPLIFTAIGQYSVLTEIDTPPVFQRFDFLEEDESTPHVQLYDSQAKINVITYRGIFNYHREKKSSHKIRVFDSEMINPDQVVRDSNGLTFVWAKNGLVSFNPIDYDHNTKPCYGIILSDILLFNKKIGPETHPKILKECIHSTKSITLTHRESVVSFEMAFLHMDLESPIQYAYKLEGYDSDWNYVGSRRVATYTNLPPGEYVFKYTAMNHNRYWAKTKELKIEVLPPFWATWWFRVLLAAILCCSGYAFYKHRTQRIRKRSEELERQVQLRTAEILSQKEEILHQKAEIEHQESQIHELYTSLTESIQTAQRIQNAMLPTENVFQTHFRESFTVYLPKDIVSGDFYWIHAQNDKIFIAAVDCTGHGVSGAFIAILGYNLLSRVAREIDSPTPASILTTLNQYVIDELHQAEDHPVSKEGMEISMCMIDKRTNTLTYSGANNKLYIARKGLMEIVNGDNNPVGILPMGKIAKFTNKVIEIQNDDVFYLFSDGFAGQFGGEFGNEKFKYPRFRDILLQNYFLPLEEQKNVLLKKLNEWRKSVPQTDDILVIGFKL